jgi:hypothetical protein
VSAPLEMNPEIRARWTAALRSGEYRQGRNYLRRNDRFCCLGVLCDLAEKAGVAIRDPHPAGDGSYTYGANCGTLPREVFLWAGLAESSPSIRLEDGTYDLTECNDEERWTFARIADAIDGIDGMAPEATP